MSLQVNSRYTSSSRAFFVFILVVCLAFFSAPEFLYFAFNEHALGRLVWSEALFALCMACFGGLVLATIFWLMAEPLRKRRNARRKLKNETVSGSLPAPTPLTHSLPPQQDP